MYVKDGKELNCSWHILTNKEGFKLQEIHLKDELNFQIRNGCSMTLHVKASQVSSRGK